jgi:hypothetical protein
MRTEVIEKLKNICNRKRSYGAILIEESDVYTINEAIQALSKESVHILSNDEHIKNAYDTTTTSNTEHLGDAMDLRERDLSVPNEPLFGKESVRGESKLKAEDILTKIANENSYESWADFVYDSHDHTILEYTIQAMHDYAGQPSDADFEKFKGTPIDQLILDAWNRPDSYQQILKLFKDYQQFLNREEGEK